MTLEHERFLTYLRTRYYLALMVGKYSRPKEIYIHIPSRDLSSKFFFYPNFKSARDEINKLVECNAIEVKKSPCKQGFFYSYKPLKGGDIDFSLVFDGHKPLSILHSKMLKYLQRASLPKEIQATSYFDNFQKHKANYARLFFIVDSFANRIHTPISNLKKTIRPHLLIDGKETASVDVVTMQPLILGKILKMIIGENEYSSWINQGVDVYNMILKNADGIESREQAKKIFFEITFGWASAKVEKMFGSANWVKVVNDIKTTPIPENPKTKEKPHSNLAWALQNWEVKIMKRIWQKLTDARIPFLTVHDEVICKKTNLKQVESLFHSVLSKEFEYYDIKTSIDEEVSAITKSDIDNLEQLLNELDYSKAPKQFEDGCILANPYQFTTDYLAMARATYQDKGFNPYLNRLIEFTDYLIANQ